MRFAYSTLTIAVLTALSSTIFAENSTDIQQTQPDATVKLNTIIVEAKEANEVGKTTYTKEDLEKIPNSSKNITDLLKVNPNVQFDNKARSGLQQGNLNLLDISINGGLPYDNKFLINGVSVNNNINPGSKADSSNMSELMGSSQTVAINTDLLCNVTLLDSNISAEYGEFSGGVVSAETCAPNTEIGKIHGSINYDYTSDSWSKIHFGSPEDLENFEDSTSESRQPFFAKQGTSANIYGKLSETLGFNAFGSYRRSDIPLKTSITTPTEFEQTRESSNAGLELFYTPDENTTLKVGAQVMQSDGTYFLSNTANSESEHRSDSQNIYFNLKNKLSSVELEQQLNYQTQTASREGAQHNYSWVTSSSKNWTPATKIQKEGSFGKMEQQEEKLEYAMKALFTPIQSGDFSHTFKMGAGYGHYNAYWERPETVNIYSNAARLANLNCLNADQSSIHACDVGNGTDGQYLKNVQSLLAGRIDTQQDRWHAYLEDKIEWNKYLIANFGVRTDYDSLSKNNNVAPRTALTIKPFGNELLSLTTGWNRYYGLNSFANELQDRKNLLTVNGSRTAANNNWSYKDPTGQYTFRSQLDTPYSDETVFGINSQFSNMRMGLKWVHRDNKDQLKQTIPEKMPELTGSPTLLAKTFDNSGQSESDIYTLSISNIALLAFGNSLHRFNLAADYTDTKRNFDNYSDAVTTGTSTVMYDGQLIDAQLVPAGNYNIPWSIRAGWDIVFNNVPLQVTNFLSYHSEYDVMQKYNFQAKNSYKDENGVAYDTYVPSVNKSTFSWDMRSTYQFAVAKDYAAILGLTINNVTNKKNMNTNSDGTRDPEIGRQFIADVTFKF
ncbi:MAG: TonB-dependent receptor plug domain-containing protein [Acinetobacter sp.]